LINTGWRFVADNSADIKDLPRTPDAWIRIDLPHTWNAFDVVDQVPGYRRGAGWYRKVLEIPARPADDQYVLSFEGVNTRCAVYINGRMAGGHIGGYIGFDVDITPFLVRGRMNTVLVRADNSIDPEIIPSQKSDFFIYGGITRGVWLKVLPPGHVRRVHIFTPAVSEERATTQARVFLRSAAAKPVEAVLEASIVDPAGNTIAHAAQPVTVVRGDQEVAIDLPDVARPRLWSPDSPALHTMEIRLKQSGDTLHAATERFGYRWYEFKEQGPFLLNGKRLLLRGTHRHEEYAGLGNALPDSLHRKDMVMIKAMGANFVRLGHYPQDPEVYRACDELGILVWDELPWCRGGVGNAIWKENTRRLLREMIDTHRNSPSIVFWSLGNELYWLPDFPGGDNLDSLRSFFAELHTIARGLDPSRLTTTRKFTGGEGISDIFSPSIWMGWYSGVYTNYEKAITEARAKYPRLFHAEYGGDSHVGRHTENPIGGDGFTTPDGWTENFQKTLIKNVSRQGDWSESYIVDLFDWHLGVSEELDWFAGNAQWAFKDFGTPLRPENPIPYVNQKGLVDRAGVPKDAYYVFKSYWTQDPKFCYVHSHSWTERSGPRGLARPVRVYSNCDAVELLVNGSSQGIRQRNPRTFPAHGLVWNVMFAEGVNTIAAIGSGGGKEAARDSVTLRYSFRRHGEADHIELTSSMPDGGLIMVTATAVDKDGGRCLSYNNRIYFTAEGAGRLLVDHGTPTRSSVIEMANGVARIEFSPVPGGRAIIEARNQDFKGSYLTILEE
jgi:beta-galactosidase